MSLPSLSSESTCLCASVPGLTPVLDVCSLCVGGMTDDMIWDGVAPGQMAWRRGRRRRLGSSWAFYFRSYDNVCFSVPVCLYVCGCIAKQSGRESWSGQASAASPFFSPIEPSQFVCVSRTDGWMD